MKQQGSEIQKFGSLLDKMIAKHIKVQTHWVVAEDIDWDEKTMTARGVIDGLEFFDVSLGLGSFYRKPKLGTMCLIGVIANQEASTFLIDCNEFVKAEFRSGQSLFTIKEDGFIVKVGAESLRTILNDYMKEVDKMIIVKGRNLNWTATAAIKQRLNSVLIE